MPTPTAVLPEAEADPLPPPIDPVCWSDMPSRMMPFAPSFAASSFKRWMTLSTEA